MMLKESAGLNLQNTIGILVTFKAPQSLPITTLTLLLHLPRGLSRIRLRVPRGAHITQVLPLLLYYEAFLSYKKTDYHP